MHILVVDDEKGLRTTLADLLDENHDVKCIDNGAAANEELQRKHYDLVIADHQMPGLTGIELIRKNRKTNPNCIFLLMTAHGSVDHALEAIRAGADDYIMKPFELVDMEQRVNRFEELQTLKKRNHLDSDDITGLDRIIGQSKACAEAKKFVTKVAQVLSPVILYGKSGTGKEVLARAIHDLSPRVKKPFVALNCASLNGNLMESELFGHERGAFTGADRQKLGMFEIASEGTLFLDEIAELPLELQSKLLRVLQEKEFFRVGGNKLIKTNVRIVAATHQSLPDMVKEGTFREDLFYRLNVLTFTWPSLADRTDDIPILLDYFWKQLSKEMGSTLPLEKGVQNVLLQYHFPGNVRELRNILERLLVLSQADGKTLDEHLPPEVLRNNIRSASSANVTPIQSTQMERGLPALVQELEVRLVREAMKKTNQNQVKAAKLLQITRGALQHRLKKMKPAA